MDRCCTNLSSSIINNYLRILLNVNYQVTTEFASQYRTIVLRGAARAPRDGPNVGYRLHSQRLTAVAHQPSRRGLAAVAPVRGARKPRFSCHWNGVAAAAGEIVMRIATTVALASALLCAGCAIRYDATGVSRVGVGLWGFGDPPGVNWNLDWPRRDVPELPASPRPELPPRRVAPQWQSHDMRTPLAYPDTSVRPPGRPKGAQAPWGETSAASCGGIAFGLEFAIGDNRDCASRCLTAIACPMAVRVRDRPTRGRSRLTQSLRKLRIAGPLRQPGLPLRPDRSPTASRSMRRRRSRKHCCATSASYAGRTMRR